MREKIFAYAQERYGSRPEYLWKRDPTSAILRNSRNRKWYAVFMQVSRDRLGLEGTKTVDVMNVKADPERIALLAQANGFRPGYHMNKKFWLSLLLDGSVSPETALDFLDESYRLVERGRR